MEISEQQIDTAYRKLKSFVYYDKTDLFLRARLAEFECENDFERRLSAVRKVVNAKSPIDTVQFKQWLEEIDFRVVPKKLAATPKADVHNSSDKGRFITNVTSASTIHVESVNYFFDGPIELHLIAVLWIMTEGYKLDRGLVAECCGSRLSNELQVAEDVSLRLFRKYHEQYSLWRDSGIRKAKDLLVADRKSVVILGLDIKEYYYRVAIDFDEVAESIVGREDKTTEKAAKSPLLACIQAVCVAYRKRIDSSLASTHEDINSSVIGLPIGFCSSLVLANWYLHHFDLAILERVRPAYYGRYVDDILLVLPAVHDPSSEPDPVASVLIDLLVNTGLLTDSGEGNYELTERKGLLLQQSKCILQYFNAEHSIAGLEKFKKRLEENGSDFLLLPVDEADSSMEDVAYELLYEGSVNKFRSVKGVAENRYELAKHLARQTILHLLTDDLPDRSVSRGLLNFFKGQSAIAFYDLWERVFTLLGISRAANTSKKFEKQVETEIGRIVVKTDSRSNKLDSLSNKLKENLTRHLQLSLSMADAICASDDGWSELFDEVHSEMFRRSNMLRHHFVRSPLLNYTTYDGPLTVRSTEGRVDVDPDKVRLSPRFVNFDELMLLATSRRLKRGSCSAFKFASDTFDAINRFEFSGVAWSDSLEVDA